MKRGYFTPPVLIILAAIIFAVAILIALNTDLVKRLKNESSPRPTPSSSPTSDAGRELASSAETANWETYTNQKFAYQFKYPGNHTPYSGWENNARVKASPGSERVAIADTEDSLIIAEPVTLSFSIEIANKTPKQWIEDYLESFGNYPKPSIKIQDTVFAGRNAVEAIGGDGGYNPAHRTIAIATDGYLLVIRQNMNTSLLTEILSTFQFLD